MDLCTIHKTVSVLRKKSLWAGSLLLILTAALSLVSYAEDRPAAENQAQGPGSPASEVVRLQTAWSVDRAHPGDKVALAVVVDIANGYHINADISQIQTFENFKPYPTRVQVVAASDGVAIENARFPEARPVKVDYADGGLLSFEGRTAITFSMKLDEQIPSGSITLDIQVEYQACSDRFCLFPEKTVGSHPAGRPGRNKRI